MSNLYDIYYMSNVSCTLESRKTLLLLTFDCFCMSLDWLVPQTFFFYIFPFVFLNVLHVFKDYAI